MPEFHGRPEIKGELCRRINKKYTPSIFNFIFKQPVINQFQNTALNQRATPLSVARFQALNIKINKGQTFLFAPFTTSIINPNHF